MLGISQNLKDEFQQSAEITEEEDTTEELIQRLETCVHLCEKAERYELMLEVKYIFSLNRILGRVYADFFLRFTESWSTFRSLFPITQPLNIPTSKCREPAPSFRTSERGF